MDVRELVALVQKRPASQRGLVSLMHVNNETGTIHDVGEMVRQLKGVEHQRLRHQGGEVDGAGAQVFVHTDAVQAPGHVPLDLTRLGVDFLTLGAHKFHGPVGVGLLYCRDPSVLQPLFFGGHQQGSVRPGTEPVALIRAMAEALDDAASQLPQREPRLREMAAKIWETLAPFIVVGLVLPTGAPAQSGRRAPHHVSFCVRGARRAALLEAFEAEGVLVSGGSACSAGSTLPSHVLSALDVPVEYIHGSVRISLSHTNTMDEVVNRLCPVLTRILQGYL